MMLKLSAFRGIIQAEISITPLALVCGPSASGKSSVAEALATVMLRNARQMPAPGLVREGAKQATCTYTRGDFTVKATSLAGATEFQGGSIAIASAVACGLESLPRMTPEQAAIHVSDFDMSAEVGDAAIAAALTAIGLDKPEQHKSVIERIRVKGWDGVLADAKDKALRLQADWQGVASVPYSAKEAAAWKPQGWGMDCEFDESVLASLVEKRRGALQAKLSGGVSPVDQSKLQAEADNLEFNRAELTRIEGQIQEKQAAVDKLNEANPEQRETVLLLEKQIRELTGQANLIKEAIVAGQSAILKLAALASETPAPEASNGEDDPAFAEREELAGAEASLAKCRTKLKADAINAQIILNGKLQEVLGPSGVRSGATPQAVAKLNAKLKEVGDKLGAGKIIVGERFKVYFNDRPFPLASRAERYRVTLALQLAAAITDKSAALIIEDIDTLDKAGRNALIRVLREYKLFALLTMTAAAPADVPDLAKAGVGNAYWCADGIVLPLAKALQATPAKGAA